MTGPVVERDWNSGRLNDAARQLGARCRSLVTTENVGIQVHVAGPFDGPELRVHRDGFECRSIVTNRSEHAAGREERRKVDLMNRAVAERQPDPMPRKGLDLGDGGAGAGHGSGSIFCGTSGTCTRAR